MTGESTSGSGRKVLLVVVEHDHHVAKLVRRFLEEPGWTVEVAEDGLDGLRLARELHPNLVIAEVLVPRIDGLSVCRALKADDATRDICVIVSSVLDVAARAQAAGADAFLRKPVDDAALVATVRELVEHDGLAVAP